MVGLVAASRVAEGVLLAAGSLVALGGPFHRPRFDEMDQRRVAETGSVTDVDGNTYRTVKIGEQWWMAENLRVTRSPAGDPIESHVYADEDPLVPTYGRMYSWDVTMDGSSDPGAQGIAPEGWHIPSDEDWNVLLEFLGGDSVAGGVLKEAGTDHWDAPNAGASDSAGFGGLPGGGFNGRIFEGLGVGGHYWSSSGTGNSAGAPTLHKDETGVTRLVLPKSFAISVRCIKDAEGTN